LKHGVSLRVGGIFGLLEVKHVRLAVEPEAAGIARAAVRDELAAISPSVVCDAELLTSELVTNAVHHAGLGPADTIELSIDLSPELLHVGVIDDGPGFEKAVQRGTVDGGWGLLLVETMSDRWGVSGNQATEVWFEIDL
jgi:anti-sigma regulatory factor (Ser/Thr protein kinase)